MEAWRAIRGYEGLYEVSSQGHVRRVGGRVLKPKATGNLRLKYLAVSLCKHNVATTRHIAHLVAAAFLGPRRLGRRRDDWQVNHIDGDKTNNTETNLEYVTHAANKRHAAAIGLMASGVRNGSAKLAVDQVTAIRASSDSAASLARQYGVAPDLIYQIRRRNIWKHVA